MRDKNTLDKLHNYDLTDFQKKVLVATMSIKKGEVKTYKQIAQQIGHSKAYRAVGTALKKNPLPIEIPCHRVIKSNGELGNYSSGGTKVKMKLLKLEGALILSR